MVNDADKPNQSPEDKPADSPPPSDSDIMALKRGHEAEITKLKEGQATELSQLNNEVASLSAGKTAVESQLATAQEGSSKAEALQKELDETKVGLAKSLADALTARRSALSKSHGLEAKTLDSMSSDQLDALESVLPNVKTSSGPDGPKGLDVTGSKNGTSTEGLSSREKIRAGIGSES